MKKFDDCGLSVQISKRKMDSSRRNRVGKSRAMRPALIFLTIFALSDGAKILSLVPHTGRSHQMVFEPLLRTLAERGHHVTVVSFFPLKDPPANYTDVSLQGIASTGLETLNLSLFESSNLLHKMPGVGESLLTLNTYQMLVGLALNVCEKAVNWPPLIEALEQDYDLVMVENFNSDCMLGLLHVYNIRAPIVFLLTCPLMPWSAGRIGLPDNPSYVPVTAFPYSTRMTFSERLINTFFNIFYKYWFQYQIQEKEKEMIERQYGKTLPELEVLGKNVSLLLVNTFHPLNGVKPLLPAVIEAGGMHLDPVRKPIPQGYRCVPISESVVGPFVSLHMTAPKFFKLKHSSYKDGGGTTRLKLD